MNEIEDKIRKREKRKVHIRKRIFGTAERPRMTVFKSNRYMYMQAIDDSTGTTIATASSLEKDLKSCERNVGGAAKLGEAMGARLKEKTSPRSYSTGTATFIMGS
jgi:large subunit ribosomal protein L18